MPSTKITFPGSQQAALAGRSFTVRRAFIEDLTSQRQTERIHALRRPLMVLHAPLDATVGIDNASHIFQAAMHPKSSVALDGADHLLSQPADAQFAADVIGAWAPVIGLHSASAKARCSKGRCVDDGCASCQLVCHHHATQTAQSQPDVLMTKCVDHAR